jgi:sulfide dehydrogenase [flavocytochrome c] flavoprotein subunit
MNRRKFLQAAGALTATSLVGIAKPALSKTAGHVVVVGAGVGGATFAKYLRLQDPGIRITVVEKNAQYLRPYGSSELITGHITMRDLVVTYDALQQKYGIDFVFDEVTEIDFDNQRVLTREGAALAYDRLVVAPGISFDFDAIDGLDAKIADEQIPHAWIPGRQTVLLAEQLKAVPKGGTAIVAPPPNPYRCPPGPYERAGFIAQYFKEHNPTAKVLVLDPKDGFTTDLTMLQAWNRLYRFRIPDRFSKYSMDGLLAAGWSEAEAQRQLDNLKLKEHDEPPLIEWIMGSMGGRVIKVDAETQTVYTESGQSFKGDLINVIPPLKAGALALRTGLADETGWCPIDVTTFESKIHKNVHVIGDSCTTGAMPKSGYSANSQAKVVAMQIKALLDGKSLLEPSFQNTCYALAGNHSYGQFVADVFRLNDGKLGRLRNPRYLPLDLPEGDVRYALAATYTQTWMKNFTEDCFG